MIFHSCSNNKLALNKIHFNNPKLIIIIKLIDQLIIIIILKDLAKE